MKVNSQGSMLLGFCDLSKEPEPSIYEMSEPSIIKKLTILLSILLLGESVSLKVILGGALITAGSLVLLL